MVNIAVFAGSFCPFTKGHEDIIQKALPLFDEIYIAIGENYQKKNIFSTEQRIQWIEGIYAGNPKIKVLSYQGLTVDLCHKIGARYLIRGIRNSADFTSEQEIYLVNKQLAPDIETIFLPSSPEWMAVSSSLVRELWSLDADYKPFLSYTLPEHE